MVGVQLDGPLELGYGVVGEFHLPVDHAEVAVERGAQLGHGVGLLGLVQGELGQPRLTLPHVGLGQQHVRADARGVELQDLADSLDDPGGVVPRVQGHLHLAEPAVHVRRHVLDALVERVQRGAGAALSRVALGQQHPSLAQLGVQAGGLLEGLGRLDRVVALEVGQAQVEVGLGPLRLVLDHLGEPLHRRGELRGPVGHGRQPLGEHLLGELLRGDDGDHDGLLALGALARSPLPFLAGGLAGGLVGLLVARGGGIHLLLARRHAPQEQHQRGRGAQGTEAHDASSTGRAIGSAGGS